MINGRINKNNSITQARRAYLSTREILEKYSTKVKVKGALVFIGIDNIVNIQSPVEDIEIILRSQLRQFIREIVEQEQESFRPSINKEELVKHFAKYQVSNPYLPRPLFYDEMTSLRKGIYCANCGSFKVETVRKQYIICACDFSEPRDRAIVRTICEYGVLQYDRNLKLEELYEFFGGDVSKSNLNRMLYKYFKTILKGRYTYHINMQLPIDKLSDNFQFSLPMLYHTDSIKYIYRN